MKNLRCSRNVLSTAGAMCLLLHTKPFMHGSRGSALLLSRRWKKERDERDSNLAGWGERTEVVFSQATRKNEIKKMSCSSKSNEISVKNQTTQVFWKYWGAYKCLWLYVRRREEMEKLQKNAPDLKKFWSIPNFETTGLGWFLNFNTTVYIHILCSRSLFKKERNYAEMSVY